MKYSTNSTQPKNADSDNTAVHPIVCLMGPTAAGKTQLAVELVQQFPFEIISVDSALVYRDMHIGTAKPTADILAKAPHRLIDICDPAEPYSAAQFRTDALREIETIFANGHIPLLVGGTMMYFRALQQGLSDLPSADPELRARLTAEGEQLGWAALHERLAQVDAQAAARIHPQDSQRIQRALEVFELTGKNLSAWQADNQAMPTDYQMVNLAVAPLDRAVLHERIAQRFKNMLAEGFVDEVQELFKRSDLTLDTPAIRAVGYRQVWEYLQGKLSYADMEQKGIIATRQLAKRQLTWLRSWPDLTWFDAEDKNLLPHVIQFLRNNKIIA